MLAAECDMMARDGGTVAPGVRGDGVVARFFAAQNNDGTADPSPKRAQFARWLGMTWLENGNIR